LPVPVAVVVAYDGRHPEWLSAALRSIDAQRPEPAERCLVVDSPDGTAASAALKPDLSRRGWKLRPGNWGDPAVARNEGMAVTKAPWVVFWDAD
jgi:glycosyltransferase involved in cell wall biosynthesis